MSPTTIPQPEPLIAFGISRVSLPGQVDNYSLESQGTKLAALGQKFNFVIPDGFLIDDEGYSGTDFNRPSIRTTLARIMAGEGNAVVFPYLDRFARNLEGGLALIRKFREAGAQVLLGEYGWVTDERHFKMQMHLGLMIAEWQRDDIADKSRSGVETKIRRGLAHGGRSPFGWHFVTAAEIAAEALLNNLPVPAGKPENVHKRVERDLATVRLMGELALAGRGQNSICRELLERGIKSPLGKVRWNATTVGKILSDPVYHTGVWHYNKRKGVVPEKIRKPHAERHHVKTSWKMKPQAEWMEQMLEGGGIWTEPQQDAIIEALKRNGQVANGTNDQPRYEALLKRLVKCRLCGKAVGPSQKSTPAGTRCWYRCTHRDRLTGKHLCEAKSVIASVLEEAVWKGVEIALTEKLDDLVAEYRERITASVDGEELARLKAQEERLAAKKQEAMDRELDADDAADKRHYANRVAEFKAQLALVRRRIASFTAEADVIEVDTAAIRRKARAAMRTKHRSEQREILVTSVHEILWAAEEAVITLRIPLKPAVAAYQRGEHHVDRYILLKTMVQVAA